MFQEKLDNQMCHMWPDDSEWAMGSDQVVCNMELPVIRKELFQDYGQANDPKDLSSGTRDGVLMS